MKKILEKKKLIALILIVSQLIVNAGTQVFAVSFSKIMENALKKMEQADDISTRYYEEYFYESKTYLYNDGENAENENLDVDENIEEDDVDLDEEVEVDNKDDEKDNNIDDNKDDDKENINVDDDADKENSLDEKENEEKKEIDESKEEESEEKIEESKETLEKEISEKEIVEDADIASASEIDDEEIVDEVKEATESELKAEELVTLDSELLGAPGDPDWSGEHVHKVCGVASGSVCLHTEFAEHGINDGLDYIKIESDDTSMTMAEIVDTLRGVETVGEDEIVIDHPEYLYLPTDITYVKGAAGNPVGSENKEFINVVLERDLYLCLNGHSLTNFIFTSKNNNFKLYITNCKQGTVGKVSNLTSLDTMFGCNVQLFGINKNIEINTARFVNIQATYKNYDFTAYSVIVDGTGAKKDPANTLIYSNTDGYTLIFEDFEVRNYFAGINESTGNYYRSLYCILKFEGTSTVIFKNLLVHDNKGIFESVFYAATRQKTIYFKGKNEIYNNEQITDAGNDVGFFRPTKTDMIVQDEGLALYNNKIKGRHIFMYFPAGSTLLVEEDSKLSINNNQMTRLTNNKYALRYFLVGNQASTVVNLLGEFEMIGNTVIKANELNTGFATAFSFFEEAGNNFVTIGDKKITIKDNKSYIDNGVTEVNRTDRTLGHYLMNVYAERKNDVMFKMQDGKKINLESRIEGISTVYGQNANIMQWDDTTTDDINAFSTIFKADNYYYIDKTVKVENGYAALANSPSTHVHKVCGIATTATCEHVEIAAHTESIEYRRLETELSDVASRVRGYATTDETAYYYLDDDVILTTAETWTLQRDVYICLNGHSMTGMNITGGAKNLYICNCKKTEAATVGTTLNNTITFGSNTHIYGQANGDAKNIIVKGSYVSGTNTNNGTLIEFYNVDIDGTGTVKNQTGTSRLYMPTADTKMVIEDSFIHNYLEGAQTIFCITGNNAKLVTRNIKMYNLGNMKFDIIHIVGTSAATPIYEMNGKTEIYDCDLTDGIADAFVKVQYGKLIVKEDAELNIYNNKCKNTYSMFWASTSGGVIQTEKNSKVSIKNNILLKANTYQAFAALNTADCKILGDFEVVDNSFYNCSAYVSGDYLAGFVSECTDSITIGAGKITVKNNRAYNDEGAVPADDVTNKAHHVYQTYFKYSDLALLQENGTKFNAESLFDGVAFFGGGTGNIVKWTSNEVADADLGKYNSCFKADTYVIAEYVVAIQGGFAKIMSTDNHTHKACGVSSVSTCTHTEVAEHTDNVSYSKLNASAYNNINSFVDVLKGPNSGGSPAYYYLTNDVTATTVTKIELKRDLYLCLNGHTLTNFRFLGNNAHLYLTNCTNTVSKIVDLTHGDITFGTNAHIFGVLNAAGDTNLVINAARPMNAQNSGGISNPNNDCYGIIFDGTGMTASANTSKLYVDNDNARVTLEKVVFRNYNSGNNLIGMSSNGTLVLKDVDIYNVVDMSSTVITTAGNSSKKPSIYLKGDVKIHDCKVNKKSGNAFVINFNYSNTYFVSGNLQITNNILADMQSCVAFPNNVTKVEMDAASSITIKNNDVEKSARGYTSLLNIGVEADKAEFLGDITVTDNRILNCGTDNTGAGLFGLYAAEEKPIGIGGGKITIKDNKAYADANGMQAANDAEYRNQHLFQLLANCKEEYIFKQAAGTKFNGESKIDGIAFFSSTNVGKIAKWTTNEVNSADIDRFQEIFVADTFYNSLSVVTKRDGYATIQYNDSATGVHAHKVCGVTTNCTHSLTASHSASVEFRQINANVINDVDTFVSIVQGRYLETEAAYFYLNTDITTTAIKKLTLTRDLYICLNGHKLKGFRFTGKGKSLYVTNCQTATAEIDENSATELLFTLRVEIYGVNRNITIRSPRIIDIHPNYDNANSVFYQTVFDATGNSGGKGGYAIIYLCTENTTFNVDGCKFMNFSRAKYLMQCDERADVNFKDVEIEGIKGISVNLIDSYVSDGVVSTLNFLGENLIHDNQLVSDSKTSIFDFTSTKVTVKSGAKLKIYNNKFRYTSTIWWAGKGSTTNFEANSEFSMTNNIMYKNTSASYNNGNTCLFVLDSEMTEFNMYGNFELTNNKVVLCSTNTAGSYIAAMHIGKGKSVNIGNQKIIINSNSSYSDESATKAVDDTKYPVQHMFQVYTGNTTLALKQKSSTKINQDTRMTITFVGTVEGTICKWTSTETTNVNAFSTIFATDAFGDDSGMALARSGNNLLITSMDNNHVHKVCGVGTTSTCTHSAEILAAHTSNVRYAPISKNATVDVFVSLIQGSSSSEGVKYYFMKKDMSVSSARTITLNRDVYLCLNGYSLKGFNFAGNGKKIYICNCQENKAAQITGDLNTEVLFRTGVQVFGINKNITISAGRPIETNNTYNNPNIMFYEVNMTGKNSKSHSANVIASYKGSAHLRFENVVISNYKYGNRFIDVNVSSTVSMKNVTISDITNITDRFWNSWSNTKNTVAWNFYGEVKIENVNLTNAPDVQFLDWSGGKFNIKNKATLSFINNKANRRSMFMRLGNANTELNINEGGSCIIDNNTMTKELGYSTGFVQHASGAINALGNFQITNNKVINCGTNNEGTYVAALSLEGSDRKMTIGSGWIKIYGNKSLKDEKNPVDDIKYPKQHMHQIYSENKNLFITQKAGTKFNPESKFEGISFSVSPHMGNIMNWTTNEVAEEDLNKAQSIFIADQFFNDEFETSIKNGMVVVDIGAAKHWHKVCGIATDSVCTHTTIAEHTGTVGYKKILEDLDSRTELQTMLNFGGGFVLTKDIDIPTMTGGSNKYITVTPAADLYICLNGHKMNGVTFVGGADKNVIITNCKANTKVSFGSDVTSNYGFHNISGEIYAVNNNIDVKLNALAYMASGAQYNQKLRLYGVDVTTGNKAVITNSYMYLRYNSSNDSAIENCSFHDLNGYSFYRSDSDRNVTFKNCTYDKMELLRQFMNFESGTNNISFIGYNKVSNMTYANDTLANFMHFVNTDAGKVVITGGELSIKNVKSTLNSNHFIGFADTKFTIDDGAKLSVTNCSITNTAVSGRGIVYMGGTSTIDCYGSLNLSDNAFTGTRRKHADAALWLPNDSQYINIGSTSIVLKNNTTTNAKANVRNLYVANENGIFRQKAGTKFNAIESRIDSVTINSEDYTGVIYENWTEANVNGFEAGIYDKVFAADKFAGRRYMIISRAVDNIVVTYGDHYHKACGVIATTSCTHTIMPDHGMGEGSDVNLTYVSLAWGNDTSTLRTLLEGGGRYFLTKKIKLENILDIDVTGEDLYLCLTSFYIENVRFRSSNGRKVIITSCIEEIESDDTGDEDEVIEDDDSEELQESNAGNSRNDRNEIGVIASKGSQAIFNCDVEIYGMNQNIGLHGHKIFESSGTDTVMSVSDARLCNDENKNTTVTEFVTLANSQKLVLDAVTISTLSNINYFASGNGNEVTLGRDVVFNNCNIKKALFNIPDMVLNQQNGMLYIKDSVFERQSGDHSLINISAESYLLGGLEVTGNKIINANDSNNQGRLAILNVATPGFIHLGNAKIYIQDNNVYSDDGLTLVDAETNRNHYLFGIFSDRFDGIFEQEPGTGMNAESRVNVSFAEPKYMGIVVKGWTIGDIGENIFTADHNLDAFEDYDRVRLNPSIDGSNVVIDNKVKIYFKKGILERTFKGVSDVAFVDIVYYGEPYVLRDDYFEQSARSITGYVDERGVRYSAGFYPTGLVKNRGKIILTALWSNVYTKEDKEVTSNDYTPTIKKDTVIVGGEWVVDNRNNKLMYYLNGSDNAIQNLFPDGNASSHVAMSTTDMRGYVMNGVYQIYTNGVAHYYMFDDNGHLVTGWVDIAGDKYYFNENGNTIGSMQFEPMIIGDKQYIFDVHGRIVRIRDLKTGVVTSVSAVYEKMVGMDDYYAPVPSLVGWN